MERELSPLRPRPGHVWVDVSVKARYLMLKRNIRKGRKVRAKKSSLTLNLETNGLKVTSEPPPMAGHSGCIATACKDRITQRPPIQAAATLACMIRLSCDNRRTRYTDGRNREGVMMQHGDEYIKVSSPSLALWTISNYTRVRVPFLCHTCPALAPAHLSFT
ncbi:hypothetical protein J6590_052135 [Homalodisca vitripennis]|nr:hypothetical protein J6590_052135 [Homalodisca vitripennis]